MSGDGHVAARSAHEAALAFSAHRFGEAYPLLHPDVVWVAVGAGETRGTDAVIAVCEQTLTELSGVTTEVVHHRAAVGADTVAVDVVVRYLGGGPDDDVSVVASCDVYAIAEGRITEIRSYTVEVDDPVARAAAP